MAEFIAVFGAEGPLGLAVVKGLSRYYRVKAIVTDTSCINEITSIINVDVLHEKKYDVERIQEVLNGASGVFVTTNTDFNNPDGYNEEVILGQKIAEACLKAKVKHVIFNTALSVEQVLGLSSRHMDAKCAIGAMMKRLNLPLTSIITPCFYEDLLHPPLKPKQLANGSHGFEIAIGNCPIDFMSIDDVGDVVASIFNGGDEYLHKTLSLSANKLSIAEIAAAFTANLPPNNFLDKMITVEQMRGKGYPGAQDLANMFDFYCRVDQRTNINLTKKLFSNLKSLQQWIQDNKTLLTTSFDHSRQPAKDPWA